MRPFAVFLVGLHEFTGDAGLSRLAPARRGIQIYFVQKYCVAKAARQVAAAEADGHYRCCLTGPDYFALPACFYIPETDALKHWHMEEYKFMRPGG